MRRGAPLLYYSFSLTFTPLFHNGPNNESLHRSQEASKDPHAPRSAFFSSSHAYTLPQEALANVANREATGYTQSGTLFHSKTRALEKAITKALPAYEARFSYPTGPIKLDPVDIPGYTHTSDDAEEPEPAFGWWRRKDRVHPTRKGETEIVYTGFQDGLARIAQSIKDEGPFDGVIGFSQGACAAGMVASLLEPGKKEAFDESSSKEAVTEEFPSSFNFDDAKPQPPLRFAIIYSGFPAPGQRYAAFYEPPLKTPTLHFLGTLDGVVEEVRSRALIERCERPREAVHPGGHFLPSQRPWLDAAVSFIRDSLDQAKDDDGGDAAGTAEKEEGVEEMNVPF
ncbi:MAG: hypothetical protein Q9207_005919 [Kuettlingeria erythrocarpa]